MQKLANIKKDTKVMEIKNTEAIKGGACSCGDKRPPRYNSNGNYDSNYNGWW